ncbi:MAG: citrate (Si)-synthase, partial [Acidimicrobiia bacterium]|nr:citrate (Si)-synthase [Acidimicrobiia bacterium]
MDEATLRIGDTELALPTLEGTMGERAVDISALRKETAYTTFDRGFGNTAETKSSITFIDGEAGILSHRGYSIEDLATKASFLEIAYLLIEGELPTVTELATFEAAILHEATTTTA